MSGRDKKEKKDVSMKPVTDAQARQKGSANVSSKSGERHERDESKGSESNTTKKQENSI